MHLVALTVVGYPTEHQTPEALALPRRPDLKAGPRICVLHTPAALPALPQKLGTGTLSKPSPAQMPGSSPCGHPGPA